jgi:altronate hydrolase
MKPTIHSSSRAQHTPGGALLRLHLEDDVAISKIDLQPGCAAALASTAGIQVIVQTPVPSGHKVALREIAPGEPVRRYGQVIGLATRPIRPGEHVHTHNLSAPDTTRSENGAPSPGAGPPVTPPPAALGGERTFMGYGRPNGDAGTRNCIAVISTVNCSAHAVRQIAHAFTPQRLAAYPNVDRVLPFTHSSGCSFGLGMRDHRVLQRVLAGIARHPNVGAYLLVGLGCEVNHVASLIEDCGLDEGGRPPSSLVIQDVGGVRKTVEAGIAAVERLLPEVNAISRTPQPLSALRVALHCGGSDGWSGVTANPTVGLVSDEIVRQGGTVVLGETTEIYGAEQILLQRAASPQIAAKLLDQIRWWEKYTHMWGLRIDNNPSPGNKAGGLTTIYEKSLGAIAKAGSTPLMGVYDYAEPVRARGFTFMDSPGNDWTGATGQVAGGCNMLIFTTGRGSCFALQPTPTIKICSNSATYARMEEDMDLNAGRVLEGEPMPRLAGELLDMVVAVASGQRSKSEAQGIGELEFAPWLLGVVL